MKSKGRVRNYVQVDNEFHFNDMIYRFYSFSEYIELEGKVVFVHLDNEKLVSLNPRDLMFTKTADDLARYLEPQDGSVIGTADTLFEAKSKIMRFNKQKIKHDNMMVNQRLKSSYRK